MPRGRPKKEEVRTWPTLPNMRQCMQWGENNPLSVEEARRLEGDENIIKMFEGLHDPEMLRMAYARAVKTEESEPSEEIAPLKDVLEDLMTMMIAFYQRLLKLGAAYYQIMLEKYRA